MDAATHRPQQERSEQQRVTVDHPLQAGDACAEVVANGWKRHVDDDRVERDDEEPEHGGDEGDRRAGSAIGRSEHRFILQWIAAGSQGPMIGVLAASPSDAER